MASAIKIYPKEIKITESYNYEIGIRKNAFMKMVSDPKGIVEILIPYDGEKYFSRDVADELLQKKDIDQLRIGWLAVGESKDWKGDWRQKIGAEILEINIPLRANGMDEDKWITDENVVQLRHEYLVERPSYHPITIDLEVLDNEATSKFVKERKINRLNSNRSSTLSFEIFFQVSMPIDADSEGVAVGLEKLIFAWPKFAPKGQIQIHQSQYGSQDWKPVEWAYIPERNEIELILDSVELKVNPPTAGSPLATYWTIFHVDFLFSVGDLITKGRFVGETIFRVKNSLLSGRDAVWIHANGREEQETTKTLDRHTLIASTFDASLSDRFANKQSFISREWSFPGVSFSPARTEDIKSILQDYGYLIGPDDNNGHSIHAWRSIIKSEHEPFILDVYIDVNNTEAITTKRERREAGEDTYVTEIKTQDLRVVLYAQINGPGRVLALDIDEIMLKLKDHFTAVADLR